MRQIVNQPYPGRRIRYVPQRKRWWRKFLSPWWLLLGAPLLLIPVLLMVFEGDGAQSPVELAIAALPIAGDASDGGNDTTNARIAPLGSTARLPPSTSLSLYNNSARAEAARMSQRDAAANSGRDAGTDFDEIEYKLMHPKLGGKEDFLVGDFKNLFTMPTAANLSWVLFHEFCTAKPDDPYFGVGTDKLPIDPIIVKALLDFVPSNDQVSYCPRLGR